MVTTPTKPAETPVAPPADPFTDAFNGLSALKEDASSVAIDAVLRGQEPPTAGPTGPTGTPAPKDGVTGPTGSGVVEEVPHVDTIETPADELAAAALAAGQETGPTGPVETGPTGEPAPTGGVDTKTFNELIATLKGAVTPPVDQSVQQPQPVALTPEEVEAVNTYIAEFPQVAAAQQIIMRREIEAAVNYVLMELASVLQPVVQRVDLVAQRNHLDDLEHMVPDYADVRQKVIDWVGTQPDYLRGAYHSVIQQGTADQVKDLIDRYRTATGTTITPVPSKTQEAELPAATKKAAAALAQVSSKRSTTTTSAPTDFDGAWDAAVKME